MARRTGRGSAPGRVRTLLGAAVLYSLGAPACGSADPGPALPRASADVVGTAALPDSSSPVQFEWDEVHGGKLSSAALLDRVTVLAFVTTYDVPSQAEVRFLSELHRDHTPRLNVAVVVLEPPENAPLALAFASALDLGYPVAMADAATIEGTGPFAGLHHVPSVVVLDRAGVERFRHLGLVDRAGLEAAVREVEGRARQRPTSK